MKELDKDIVESLSLKFINLIERTPITNPGVSPPSINSVFYNARETAIIKNYRKTSKLLK